MENVVTEDSLEGVLVDVKHIFTIDSQNYDKTKITAKPCQQGKYVVLNNDSSMITFDNDTLRLYRSLILDAETNQWVCFSPPNAMDWHAFAKKYPDDQDLYVNEIMEGTMVNLFFDERRDTWEIATRGSVGGNYWYYKTKYSLDETTHTLKPDGLDKQNKQKTFRAMFWEALRGEENQVLNDHPVIQQLPRDHTYSFVLQHPDNHIVLPITEPHLFLVGVFRKVGDSAVEILSPVVYENWGCFTAGGIIEFPPRWTIDYAKGDAFFPKTNEYAVGCMITHVKTGVRTTLSNPAYEELKKWRGNNPNLQYQYFCLGRAGQRDTFLTYFPRYTHLFRQFHRQYEDFVTRVHRAYYSYYVEKEGIPVPKKYFLHASRLHHQVYLPSLQEPSKKIITRNVVKEYFEQCSPSDMLYYLHYDQRQLALTTTV